MKSKSRRLMRILFIVLAGFVLITLPQFYKTGYVTNLFIDLVRWTIFALSYDLVAGHVSAVSLGQPVFYAFGAYIAVLLGPVLGLSFLGSILLAAVSMAILALGAGVAFFRTRRVTFAIGTLGAAIIAQILVNNATRFTGGAMCKIGIARPEIAIPFTDTVIKIVKPLQYYYLLLPMLAVTLLIYWALTTGRIGRAFASVREDEVRATAIGIHPLRYRQLAFAVGSGIAGALGAFQASYLTVVCPTELSQEITTTLLIIVFVGGAASMRGVLLGALLFTLLPRFLEVVGGQTFTPAYQQVLYGMILVVVMLFMPEGIEGLIKRYSQSRRKREKAVSQP